MPALQALQAKRYADLSRKRAGNGGVSVLWMQRSTETRHCERLAVNVPRDLVIDRLVMNLFNAVQ